jgi:branched-chain amino acid transport system ATP-binding protein
MLKLVDVSASYGAVRVLHDVSLEVNPGEIRAILGANGAGKSTLLKVILGLVRAQSGTVTFDGTDLLRLPAHEVCGTGVAWVPQGRLVFSTLSVRDNLELGAFREKSAEKKRQRLQSVHDMFPVLLDRGGQLAGSLSGGEQQMLTIGRALMSGPSLLLMDEPSLGLSPQVFSAVFRTIAEINRSGTAVLIVEQNARQALQIAQWGYVLVGGRVVASGTPQEIEATEAVRRAYLGH